jgi:probable HAF family extracellular repeat protein
MTQRLGATRRVPSLFLRGTIALAALAGVSATRAGPLYHVIDLGSVGAGYSGARGINSSGQIVGYSALTTGVAPERAFLFSSGIMHDLGILPGFFQNWANGINDSGQVVGSSQTAGSNSVRHASLYSGGVWHDLGTFGGTSSDAIAINNSGQVVGLSSYAGDAISHAFLYSNGVMHDLGAIGGFGNSSDAEAINDSGQVAGGSFGDAFSTAAA